MSEAPPQQEPTPETSETPPVEIHTPHAVKTWKEFFIELGTVVLGILIAITLEQMVENWHESRLHRAAATAMRSELESNLGVLARRFGVPVNTVKTWLRRAILEMQASRDARPRERVA